MAQTVPLDPAWSFQLQDSAKISRYLLGQMFPQGGATPNAKWRSGVIPSVGTGSNAVPIDLIVTQNTTPNLGVALFPGGYVIDRPSQGPYIGEIEAQINSSSATPITFTTAPGTGQSRIDIIAIQVLDSAIGDASLAAQVIVVLGTAAATGSQVPPTLPVTGACIPLAQVLIGPNATTITSANITDVRKSTSVGRGPRFLLPGDALSDPGFMYGELRQRLLTTYPSNGVADVITEYWGFDSAWHGTKDLNPGAAAWQNGTSNTTLSNSAYTSLMAVTIPDPGYAYYLACSASAQFNQTGSTWTAGSPPLTNLQITLGSLGGTVVNNNQVPASATFSGSTYQGLLTPKKTARLTGATTVILSAESVTVLSANAQAALFAGVASGQTYLDVTVIPA
jgi:hypothetical protein